MAAVIAENGLKTKFKMLGLGDGFIPMAHAEYIYHKFGFDTEGLISAMEDMLRE